MCFFLSCHMNFIWHDFNLFFFFIDNEEAKPEKTSEYILPSSDFLFCYWKEERRIGFEIFKLQVACSWSFSVSDWAQHWEMNKHFENLSSVHLEYKGCVPGLHWCRDSACAALLCGSQRRRDWGTDQNLQPQPLLPPVVGTAHSESQTRLFTAENVVPFVV